MLTAGLRRLLHTKIHLAPELSRHRSGPIAGRLQNRWQGAVALAELLVGLPETALTWWSRHPVGHLVLTAAGPTRRPQYQAGPTTVGRRSLAGVAYVPLMQVLDDPVAATAVALLPLDHLLGCGGLPEGLWLSQGGGVTPAWMEVGADVHQLFGLGYGSREEARRSAAVYLADGLALTLHRRREANTQDPKLERLLDRTVLNEAFWQKEMTQPGMTLG